MVRWMSRLERIEHIPLFHESFSSFLDANKNLLNKKQVPEKGPVMLLYELFNDVTIECISSDGVQHSRFKMVATVNNQRFEGTGNRNWKIYRVHARNVSFNDSTVIYLRHQQAHRKNWPKTLPQSLHWVYFAIYRIVPCSSRHRPKMHPSKATKSKRTNYRSRLPMPLGGKRNLLTIGRVATKCQILCFFCGQVGFGKVLGGYGQHWQLQSTQSPCWHCDDRK